MIDSISIDTLTVNLSKFPDSYLVSLADTVKVSTKEVPSFMGLCPEWGAVVIPTVASLLVFILGLLFEKYKRKKEKKQETDQFRVVLFKWIDLSIAPVQKQIDTIKVFAKQVSDNRTIQQERLAFPKTISEKLDIITATNVVKYLVLRSSKPKDAHSEESAYNIVAQFDFLQSFESEIMRQYDAYQFQSKELFNEWNDGMVKLGKQLSTVPTSRTEYQIYSNLKQIYDNYCKNYKEDTFGEVNILYVKSKLLEPIIACSEDYPFGIPELFSIDIIIQLSRSLMFVIGKWEILKKSFSRVFSDYAENAQASLKSLIEAKNYFEIQTKAIR